jgi:hypothetical protein
MNHSPREVAKEGLFGFCPLPNSTQHRGNSTALNHICTRPDCGRKSWSALGLCRKCATLMVPLFETFYAAAMDVLQELYLSKADLQSFGSGKDPFLNRCDMFLRIARLSWGADVEWYNRRDRKKRKAAERSAKPANKRRRSEQQNTDIPTASGVRLNHTSPGDQHAA